MPREPCWKMEVTGLKLLPVNCLFKLVESPFRLGDESIFKIVECSGAVPSKCYYRIGTEIVVLANHLNRAAGRGTSTSMPQEHDRHVHDPMVVVRATDLANDFVTHRCTRDWLP